MKSTDILVLLFIFALFYSVVVYFLLFHSHDSLKGRFGRYCFLCHQSIQAFPLPQIVQVDLQGRQLLCHRCAKPYLAAANYERRSRVDACEKCRTVAEGRAYIFYYGKYLSTRSYRVPGGIGIETRYQIAGKDSAFLCGRCVRRRQKKYLLLILMLLLMISLIFFCFRHLPGAHGSFDLGAYLGGIGIVLLIAGLVCMPLLLRGTIYSGCMLAIKMKRTFHESRGFRAFFRADRKSRLILTEY